MEEAEAPLLEGARAAGVGLLVEPTPPGIGRDPLLQRRLSEHAFVAVVASTGLYKEPLLPRRAYTRSVEDLAAWMAFEINTGILPVTGDSLLGESLLSDEALGRAGDALNETPVRAGVIKLAASDGGLQEVEAKALRAALVAARETGAAVISHCPSGAAFQQQLDVLEGAGGDPGRFVQVHAHAEPDFELHLRALRRGAWLEYDAIGGRPDALFVDLVRRVLDAGFAHRLLLSQDVVGWRAGAPGGGNRDELRPAQTALRLPAHGLPPRPARCRGGRSHLAPADGGEPAGPLRPRPRLTPPACPGPSTPHSRPGLLSDLAPATVLMYAPHPAEAPWGSLPV